MQEEVYLNTSSNKNVKVNKIYKIQADSKSPVKIAYPGDIVGLVIDETYTSQTICDEKSRYRINQIRVPEPIVDMAVIPKTREDQDRFGSVIQYYMKEDPSIKLKYNSAIGQTIISGVGKLQIEVLVSRLLTEKEISLDTMPPRISYRETIDGIAEENHTHSKQTGGRGQYARIHMKISKSEQVYEFKNYASGRDICTAYVEAIQQGINETLKSGHYQSQVLNVKVEILGGDMHEVDSSADVFKRVAANLFRKLLGEAKPVLLEPICSLNIYTSNEFVNNITGDIYSKKGQIIDCSGLEGNPNKKVIKALLSGEYVFDYAEKLRSISKGMASFDYKLDSYAPCAKDTVENYLKFLESQKTEKAS